jgi:hypothetical protein
MCASRDLYPSSSREPRLSKTHLPPAARCARGFGSNLPLERQGAGKTGCARCTRGLACQCTNQKCTRAYRFSGSSPDFPAQWFYGLFRALPGETRLVCHRRPRKRELLKSLTPAIGASGPHDFAVRITRCSSKAHPRPPLPAPTSVTMANAPLSGRDARNYAGDLGQKQRRWPGGCHVPGTVIHYQHIPRLSPLVLV